MSGTRSTAAAIPVLNEKKEVTMQKVKVQRYVTGRRPDYAEGPSDEDSDSDTEIRAPVVRKVADPVIISLNTCKDEEQDEVEEPTPSTSRHRHRHYSSSSDSGSDSGNEDDHGKTNEDDDDDVARRHDRLRRIKAETEEEELLANVGGDSNNEDDEEDESDEDEEYESEDDALPRLKPVFVRKDDRVTVKEREIEEKREKEREEAALREAEERRLESLKIIEDDRRREEKEKQDKLEDEALAAAIDAICTDDEVDADGNEAGYEMWKLRELKRVKRDKDEQEEFVKMEEEKEKLRNMTEEERQAELERNPKIVTNAAEKGKYKFMQKYYHRGAFYLDSEDEVFKRNVAEPTLEDHFDKSILPKVMQVKNFGRAGRTKYTHLVDQDTTAHDGPWAAETNLTQKFKTQVGGGFKPVFERPSKKRKT